MAPAGAIPVPVGKLRDWSKYHERRESEIEYIQSMFVELCRPITTPRTSTRGGRPRVPVADVLYALVLRTYLKLPCRRLSKVLKAMLAQAQAARHISRVPGASSIQAYLGAEWMESLLTELIITTSYPLRFVETVVAVDCSGFGIPKSQPYHNRKTGSEDKEIGWKRAHAMCGVRSGIITAAIVTGSHVHESTHLPELLDVTCQRFKVKEVLADSGFSSVRNLEFIVEKGADPYIDFKGSVTGATPGVWREEFIYYTNHRSTWEEHYRKRRMIETVWGAIKERFGEPVRSKSDKAAENEVLLKLLCYNLCCLIRCADEYGIEVDFHRSDRNGWLATTSPA
jgi:hypothetical protein